jgi:hypothetical protein
MSSRELNLKALANKVVGKCGSLPGAYIPRGGPDRTLGLRPGGLGPVQILQP